MTKAVQHCHDVFLRFVPDAPRFVHLQHGANAAELDLQMQIYRAGSRSVKVVERRARLAESFFLDLQVLGWSLTSFSEWFAAAWVRSQVSSGRKTAGASARMTLRLVRDATGLTTFCESPLVLAQGSAESSAGSGANEPPEPAKVPEFDILQEFEIAMVKGDTVQQRGYLGFFVFLSQCSARCSDGQRSRKLKISEHALCGESRMKNKKCWTRWFCPRDGFFLRNWADEWLASLQASGLPGPDFLLNIVKRLQLHHGWMA